MGTVTTRKGTELCPADQRHVLAAYVHRHTGDHRPACLTRPHTHPVQFKDDRDWLENTVFRVRKDGGLDRRCKSCESYPTWPDLALLDGCDSCEPGACNCTDPAS